MENHPQISTLPDESDEESPPPAPVFEHSLEDITVPDDDGNSLKSFGSFTGVAEGESFDGIDALASALEVYDDDDDEPDAPAGDHADVAWMENPVDAPDEDHGGAATTGEEGTEGDVPPAPKFRGKPLTVELLEMLQRNDEEEILGPDNGPLVTADFPPDAPSDKSKTQRASPDSSFHRHECGFDHPSPDGHGNPILKESTHSHGCGHDHSHEDQPHPDPTIDRVDHDAHHDQLGNDGCGHDHSQDAHEDDTVNHSCSCCHDHAHQDDHHHHTHDHAHHHAHDHVHHHTHDHAHHHAHDHAHHHTHDHAHDDLHFHHPLDPYFDTLTYEQLRDELEHRPFVDDDEEDDSEVEENELIAGIDEELSNVGLPNDGTDDSLSTALEGLDLKNLEPLTFESNEQETDIVDDDMVKFLENMNLVGDNDTEPIEESGPTEE